MTDDLDTLRPEVREAVEHCDRNFALAPYNGHRANWPLIRAELLRLQSTESRANEWQSRAERAEAELAALKARIADAPVADVIALKNGCGRVDIWGLPHDWVGKRVALVKVEE